MIWPVFIVAMSALAIIGAVLAAIWWFVARTWNDVAESDADRAYRWREQMRSISHNRR